MTRINTLARSAALGMRPVAVGENQDVARRRVRTVGRHRATVAQQAARQPRAHGGPCGTFRGSDP